MKKIFIFLFFSTAYCSVMAQLAADKLNGSVSNGKLVLNKKEISKDWKLPVTVSVLGTAERIRDGANKTHTYDNYGIVLFERKLENVPSDTVSEVQIYFSEMEKNSVTPNGFYTGDFSVEKIKLSKDFSADELKEKLKNYSQSESYMPHNYRFARNGIYIYFQFSDDEKKLQKISIGRDVKE